MSIEESDHSSKLLHKLRSFSTNEPEYLRLLHEVIEYLELLQQPIQMHQPELLKQFQSIIIPEIIRIMNEKEPSMVDNTRHKIRRYSLEILFMTPFPDQRENTPFDQIINLLMNVIKNDNEENAELALKILVEIQKFYKTNWDVLENNHQEFLKYCQVLYKNLPRKLDEVKNVDETTFKGTQQQEEQTLIPSERSIKTLSSCNHYFLLVNSLFEDRYKENIIALLHSIFAAIETFPESILPEVKNMALYMEYLDTLKNILTFFSFIFKKNFTHEVIDNLGKILGAQIKILKNTPQHGMQIRKDILHMIKYEITEIFNLEKNDRQQRIQERDHLYQKRNQILSHHINDFLDLNTIFGKGKLNKDLQFHTKSLIFTFISQNKEVMSEDQLKKSLQIIIKNILDPTVTLTMKNTLIYILYRKNEELQQLTQNRSGELQLEVLENLIMMYKDLDFQLRIAVQELSVFKQEVMNQRKNSAKWMNDYEQRDANYKDLFFQEEFQFIDIDENKDLDIQKVQHEFFFHYLFEPTAMQSGNPYHDITKIRNKYQAFTAMTDNQLNHYLEQQKEICVKLVKNLNSFIDSLLITITDYRQNKFYKLHEMKLLRKLFIHGSRVIQHLYELFATEKEKVNDVLKRFARIFQQMNTLQFRDLLYSVEDEFFGHVIEVRATKKETGIYYLADYLMSFQTVSGPNYNTSANSHLDDKAAYMNEIFFNYINKKMRIFNKAMENEVILTTNAVDLRFAKLPTPDLQDALQKLTLTIGEKALSKKNDQRMKNLFFSVFVFCIKYTSIILNFITSFQIEASQIVPYYYAVIRNMFKVLCNLQDNSNFMKEFIPMIQGLLETFLQAKEEASFIKETNEICYSVPAKLKNLIEYLPIISRPLIDSMKSNNIELIESGINSIQMWVSALASYPEILDPVITNILPELNSLLYRILYLLPNYSFKLLGKLGSKSRLYYEDKEFKSRNYPEDGLKIELKDKHSGKDVILGIDTAIDVVLLKIFDSYHKYNHQKLMEAYKLVKVSFLCFINPDTDIDYLIASIVNAKTKNTELLTAYTMNATKYFNSKQTYPKISALGKGSESHAFEKILKCLLIACSLPKDNPETQIVHKKVKKFFKWITQYFTLIYICKNGKLKENLVNEISPLVFIENICDFLYYNMLQGLPKFQQRSYFKGSVTALKTMLRFIKDLYGEEDDRIYDQLEFLQILIQRICHLSYGQDLPKKVAATLAIQILIKELPKRTIRNHWQSFLDSLFYILNTNNESLVYQVESECKKTLDKFFEKVGMYQENVFTTIDEEEKSFNYAILDKVMQNLHQNKVSSRNVAIHFIELISRKSGYSVNQMLNTVQCSYYSQQQPQNEQVDRSWAYFLVTTQIESKAKSIFNLFKGGYSSIMILISYLELLQFLINHKVVEPHKKIHVYLAICEQLLKVLEEEIEKSDSKNDSLLSFNNDLLIGNAAKAAVKYMKLERGYISQNKIHDPYSHSVYPHQSLQNQHFEVEELAKRDKQQQEIEQIQYSYRLFEIFQDKYITPEQVNPKAYEEMQQEEQQALKQHLQLRINEFISKLFQTGIKASDISFEYVHHMYQLFPNVRLHNDLICKCLGVLCDISTEDNMHSFFKERQQQFFDQQQVVPPGQQPQTQIGPTQPSTPKNQNLTRRIDLYAVEIKSKIIAVYFKFFQREEDLVYKSAKKCLIRTLRKETNQQEALPNQILKECVRPSLNILSQKGQFPALYEQLTKLINVLHGCFNEQLGKHLIKCYESNKAKTLEKIQLNLNPVSESGQQASGQTMGEGSSNYPNQQPSDRPSENMSNDQQLQQKQKRFNENYEKLIIQQNQKIEDLEIANHIIKILYLLPTSRQDTYRILTQLPEFELQVIQELETNFEESYKTLIDHFGIIPMFNHEQHVRPLAIKLGVLKSDYREGLAKFYNKNPFESLEIFKSINKLTPTMLDILKDPRSFCLRERLAREPEIIRTYLLAPVESQAFEVGMQMVSTLMKYIPNYLTLSQNYLIVDALRNSWKALGAQNLDELIVKFQNQSQIRRVYQKIQKCLLSYCRSPNAKIKIIFELIKGYRYQPLIDMTPVKIFFNYEIPYNFPLKKKSEILNITLESIKFTQNYPGHDELKFLTFELAFMPSIIKHSITGDQNSFKELIDERLMRNFIDTFFGVNLIQTPSGPFRISHIETLRQNLEISQTVSYEQFQIEIIKVINLMFRHFDYHVIQACCPQREVTRITQFLYQCAKKANNSLLKEWAYYTLTSLFFKILDAQAYEQRMNLPSTAADENMLQMIAQSSEQVLMMILQHGANLSTKALVHKSFRNLFTILNDPRIRNRIPQNTSSAQSDYVAMCLKRALIFEGRNTASLMYLSSFILGHHDSFYYQHHQFMARMHRIILRFGAQLQPNLAQKQLLVEISAVLISWIQRRIYSQQVQGRITDEQANSYQTIFTSILFYLIRTSVMVQFSQNEPVKEVLDLSNQCLRQIINLVRVFPNVKIQFPYFNRLLTTDASDRENLQIIRMAILNVSFILIKYQRQTLDFKNFFFDYIVTSNLKYQKGILFTCKNLLLIINSNQDPQFQNTINTKIKAFIAQDLQKSQDESVNEIQSKIKQIEDTYNMERKPIQLSFQECAMLISNTIPHFTIRFIAALEMSMKEQGLSIKDKNIQFSDNEFQFFKDLATAIFRVVGYFRKHILFDQNDVSPQKIRVRHNVVYQATNCLTEYTNMKELIQMKDDIVELKVEEPNYDLFNKESIMMAILFIIKKIKKMNHEESIQILEIIQYTMQTLIKYNTNEYMIEQLRKIVDALIDDEEDDVSRLLMEQKYSFVTKMLAKISQIQTIDRRDQPANNTLIEALFEQSVKFLEKQSSMYKDYTIRLFEQVFINLRGKRVELKHRVFKIFEKLNGSSLYKKLQYFFSKHQLDDSDKLAFFQSQSQLLDFTLYNFITDVPLRKTKYSSRLFQFKNPSIKFDIQVNQGNPVNEQNSEYHKITNTLAPFKKSIDKYKELKLHHLMDPLSEIISINPNHSTDKMFSDKLFIKLFWQYWIMMSREEQQILSESINNFFMSTIPVINNSEFKKNSFPKNFLEAVATISPQIRLEPELLQFLGKNLNLWHVSIPILENHITLYPDNERYIFSLNELYAKLVEEDYIAGLRRLVTDSQETRSIVSYGQHHMWEEINQQFSQFMIYYAEQEGLYQHMDREYNMPGKYQRQVPHQLFSKLKENHKEEYKRRKNMEQNEPITDWTPFQEELKKVEEELEKEIEEASQQKKVSESSSQWSSFSKQFKEVDLRIWETLFIESLKVLNKWDQYRDIAHALSNQEMMIEYLWNVKDWRNLLQYESILKKSDSIKYQLYYIYLIIYQQQISQFDDMFKQVIQLSYKEWDYYLPNYIDNIQFENLIMFQLVMESSEGGRNMIREAQNLKMRGRLSDLKTAINIWRERAPNMCEGIQSWKEVLENRNFIQNQISHIISPVISSNSGQLSEEEFKLQRQQQEAQRQQFVNEFLDISWNYYKLAQVSRKQGLPTLSSWYQTLLKNQLQVSGDSEGVKYERFKCDQEDLKLNLQFNTNPTSLSYMVDNYAKIIKAKYLDQSTPQYYEPWQIGELCRLVGNYYLKSGDLGQSQFFLTKSIELNKKEAKTWMSYAKLNQTVYENMKNEHALQNTLKGYLNAVVLNLPNSRPIIPQILKLIKKKDLNSQQYTPIILFMKNNLEQMPAWIWIFWIPQVLHLLFHYQNNIELRLAISVLDKLSRLYPQALYHPLKMKSSLAQPEDQQQLQIMQQQVRGLINNIQRAGLSSIHYSDRISQELYKNMKSTAEEELYVVLTKILCMSQFFKIDQFESEIHKFLNQINEKFMRDENLSQSVLMSELKPIFLKDFIDESTREKDILEVIKRMKNLKDFLHKKLSLTEQKTNLEQVSPYLANFHEKGVELPGQYIIIDSEPHPQNTIYIQKFEPVIYRGNITTKKLVIKGSNQKVYAFVTSGIQGKEDYMKHCSEERVIQIKSLMNHMFAKHKETLKRNIKFYIPIKVMMYRSKLSQDDLSFANLQEIHDYLFQERGLDSDQSLNLQIKKVEEIFNEYPEGKERTISSLDPVLKRKIDEDTYYEMKSIYCQPYLLSSFFHRIFYNVEDLFIFKKQFTTYHAVNSFFSYVFSQVEQATLNQISFCKTSGRLNYNETKLIEFLKNRSIKQHVMASQGKPIDYGAIEKEEIYTNVAVPGKHPNYLPFRLTNNIVDFIGRIGLNGLFAGVMTSCSLALQKDFEKVMPLIQLVYRDELLTEQKEQMLYFIRRCCDYMKYKMHSLSNNKQLIDRSSPSPQSDQSHKEDQKMDVEDDTANLDDCIMFGNFKVPKQFLRYQIEKPHTFEEFNKKVFKLIEVATDDKRLAQMPSNWNAWF